jgi:hypothetical protein
MSQFIGAASVAARPAMAPAHGFVNRLAFQDDYRTGRF